MRSTLIGTLALLVAATTASAQERRVAVAVPLRIEAISAEAAEPRIVMQGEPFLVQRVMPLGSVRLLSDVTVRGRSNDVTLQSGATLIAAIATQTRQVFFCASYDPNGGFAGWLNSHGRTEWLCFLDQDRNDSFETVYLAARNVGDVALLPGFTQLETPRAVEASYTLDPVDQTFAFERAFFFESGMSIYGRTNSFRVKVRPAGEGEWINLLSIGRGTQGGSAYLQSSDIPGNISLLGVRLRVLAEQDGGLLIDAEEAPATIATYGVR